MYVTICSWCEAKGKMTILSDSTLLDYIQAVQDGTVSHGMCDDCKDKWLEDATRDIRELRLHEGKSVG